jgi:hypothetical protein
MEGTFMDQIFGSEFVLWNGESLGEKPWQVVEFKTSAKDEWKSKAEDVEYEDC